MGSRRSNRGDMAASSDCDGPIQSILHMAASLLSLFPTYMTKRSPPEIWDVVVRLEVNVFIIQIGSYGASQISGGESLVTTGILAPKARGG